MPEFKTATKQYNWKGEVVGYQSEGGFYPAHSDIWSVRLLEESIANGTCQLLEPQIDYIERAYDKNGKQSGYLFQGMYVPCDKNNDLYRIIQQALTCNPQILNEPSIVYQPSKGERIDYFILGFVFDSPWQRISKQISYSIPYNFSANQQQSFDVLIYNLSFKWNFEIQKNICKNHETDFKWNEDLLGNYHIGVLEIFVPVNLLRKIFKDYRTTYNIDGIIDEPYEMHMAQTKRNRHEGPDIMWLISFIRIYIGEFAMDIANRVIEGVSLETRDTSIKFVNRSDAYNGMYLLKVFNDGRKEYEPFVNNQTDQINMGDLSDHIGNKLRILDSTTPYDSFRNKYIYYPLKKINLLLNNGLTMESLVMVNSYLEVSFLIGLLNCVYQNPVKQDALRLMGYKRKLDIYTEISTAECLNKHFKAKLSSYISAARRIYKIRNGYVHALQKVDEDSLVLTNKERNDITILINKFVQPYESDQFAKAIDILRTEKQGVVDIIDKHINIFSTQTL